VVFLLVTAAASLFAAALAGLIRNRSTAALVGSVVAFSIFSAPWFAARAGLLGSSPGDDDGEVGWWLITILGAPIGLLGGLTALVGSVLLHPTRAATPW
jgi:hypothetical protein